MDLKHSFTVPASVADTWKTFEDIESVAGCFPGATVTEVDGDDFKGSCKVKLGPIAMVYSGVGTFVEKDEAARKFVIDAKGKDKRGNGTAGAKVTATFTEEGSQEGAAATRVDVVTDLAITGKPAQFGRGVIEDVSNKLLGQFVDCLKDKVGAPSEPEAPTEAAAPSPSGSDAAGDLSGPRKTPSTAYAGASAGGSPGPSTGSSTPTTGSSSSSSSGSSSSSNDDALDLGATVIPILARTYGPQAAIALVALLLGWLIGRRGR
jgi:carbon monoxide dehydrogenase subunit G